MLTTLTWTSLAIKNTKLSLHRNARPLEATRINQWWKDWLTLDHWIPSSIKLNFNYDYFIFDISYIPSVMYKQRHALPLLMKAITCHDAIKWKHFPHYWPFARGIHRWLVNSPQKGQWRRALMFSLMCALINGCVNNRDAGDLRRHRASYDVIVVLI